ncbi:MAG: autoinducer binding domain-containing protein [Roseovarius sp.]
MIPTQDLNAFLHAPTIEDLWGLLTRRMEDYGFDRLIYGATRYRTATSLGDPDDFVLLTNHAPEFTEGHLDF